MGLGWHGACEPRSSVAMWTPGQLVVFAIVMLVVGGMAFFVWRVRSTVSRPTRCPSCGATITRDALVCPNCGNTL